MFKGFGRNNRKEEKGSPKNKKEEPPPSTPIVPPASARPFALPHVNEKALGRTQSAIGLTDSKTPARGGRAEVARAASSVGGGGKAGFVPTVRPTMSLSVDPMVPAAMRPGEDVFTANLASAITAKSQLKSSGSPSKDPLSSSGGADAVRRPSNALPSRFGISLVVPSGSQVDLKCGVGDTAADFIRSNFNKMKFMLGATANAAHYVLQTPDGETLASDALVASSAYVEQCVLGKSQPSLFLKPRERGPAPLPPMRPYAMTTSSAPTSPSSLSTSPRRLPFSYIPTATPPPSVAALSMASPSSSLELSPPSSPSSSLSSTPRTSNAHSPFSLSPATSFVAHTQSGDEIPTSPLATTSGRATSSDLSSSPPVIDIDVHEDEPFDLQVLLAGAVTTIVECKPTDTAGDVLARLDIPDSRLHCYSLATPASSALDGALVLSKLEYIRECRRHYILPQLRVVEDAPSLSKEEKKENKDIGGLIGQKLCWTNVEDEISAFRKTMARVRKEVVLAEELRGLDDGELNIRLSGAPNPTVDGLLIRVVLPLEKKSTNLLITNDRGMETADSFLQRLLQLPLFSTSGFYHAQTHPHLLLRAKGRLEHIVGKYPLLAFAYIQECVESKRWPKLVLLKRSEDYIALAKPKQDDASASSSSTTTAGWTSARVPRTPRVRATPFSPRLGGASEGTRDVGESETGPTAIQEVKAGEATEWEEDCEGDQVDDEEEALAPRYDHALMAGELVRWDQKSHISLWELENRPFRIKVMGVERINELGCPSWRKFSPDLAPDDVIGSLYVHVGVYYGGQLLVKDAVTKPVPCSANPRWGQWLTFDDLLFSNVPRESRVCCTLYAKTARETDAIPLAWANFNIFDYKHELRSGLHTLSMWPDGPANPIGTCVGNAGFAHATQLALELDSFPLPVVFPTEGTTGKTKGPNRNSCLVLGGGEEELELVEEVEKILAMDSLHRLTPTQKKIVNTLRGYCLARPNALPKFLQAVNYADHISVQEMHSLLGFFRQPTAVEALELLDSKFPDAKVRDHAVECLEALSHDELLDYLLQLVQVIKYETYHDSALVRFLLRKALENRHIGNAFYWYLRSEVHAPEISERYSLILEAYLRGSPSHRRRLHRQNQALNAIYHVGTKIKDEAIKTEEERAEVLSAALAVIKLPSTFGLPLRADMEVADLLTDKCKFMDSKKRPLWLVFENAQPARPPIYTIFKCGDDLRQDMLTLQMLRIMDKMWKNEGYDLCVTPYGCIATGADMGFIEVVQNSATTAAVAKESGYGARGAFKEDPLKNWLLKHNPTKEQWDAALRNFIRSCAAYCVATYVLGIGDRHNDNVMVTKDGRLFHIDFGHFLGNFKKKFGFKRERAPFVLTPDHAFVMGGRGSEGFTLFITTACRAYNILRKHASVFINLFAMMLSTGIPELKSAEDLEYLRYAFATDLDDNAAAARFTELIHAALDCWTTRFNNAIHLIAHGGKG